MRWTFNRVAVLLLAALGLVALFKWSLAVGLPVTAVTLLRLGTREIVDAI